MRLALFLPNLRVDDCGVTLEEFFRNLANAVKVASADNYQFPLYSEQIFQPLTGESPDVNSSNYVMFQQSLLAKYQVLPEEKAVIELFPTLLADANRIATDPGFLTSETFYKRYLSGFGDGPILDAIDSLLFFFSQRSSRMLTARKGMEVLRDLFLDKGLIERTEIDAGRKYLDSERPELPSGRVELTLPFKMMPTDTVYICRDTTERPLECSNSFFVKFPVAGNDAQSAVIDFYLSPDEQRVYLEGSPARASINGGVREAFLSKFPALKRYFQAEEAQAS
jgi:hypothetical protein